MANTPERASGAPKHSRHMASAAPSTQQGASSPVPRRVGTPLYDSNRQSLHMKLPTVDTGADATSAWIPTTPESESPRPIGVDPAATGSFSRLTEGEGARITTRENAELGRTAGMAALKVDDHRIKTGERPKVKSRQTKEKHDRRLYIGLGIFAIVLLAIAFFVIRDTLLVPTEVPTTQELEQTQVDVGETIVHGGASYALMEQGDGSVALTYQPEGASSPQVLCIVPGKPVQLVLYNNTFVIPENLNGSWDVLAFMRGISTEAAPVVDAEGAPVGGEGSISSVKLDGAVLHVTTDSGTVDVRLD